MPAFLPSFLPSFLQDENHRNGQDSEVPLLIKRDRNHPSVVIWSICNEVLCDTTGSDWVADALRIKGEAWRKPTS